MIGTAIGSGAIVLRSRARRGNCRRVVIGDFLWPLRIANVEHPDTGFEVAARQRRCIFLVVDAAVMRAVRETAESRKVRYYLVAICYVVVLQQKFGGHDRIFLIGHVDDSRHRPRRKIHPAGCGPLGQVAQPAGTAFVGVNQIRLTFDQDRNGVLRVAAVVPGEHADHLDLGVGFARLYLTHVEDKQTVVRWRSGST